MSTKILICDDEPFILESLGYIAKQGGYDFVTAEDGIQSLGLAKKEKPVLMFLDVNMPKMSGYEVCERLKSDPETKDIHIIMLTARGQERDEKMGIDSGANEYITKPFSPRALMKRMSEILGE